MHNRNEVDKEITNITAAIVEKAQTSVEAFDIIYHKLSNEITRYIRYFIQNREDVEDLIQETFMRGWKYLVSGQFKEKASEPETNTSFRALLYKIARSLIIDYRKREPRMIFEDLDTAHHISDGSNPESIISEREAGDILLSKINELRAEYRDIFILHYFEGLRFKDISDILGIPLATALVYHQRAKQVMKRKYGTSE